jgi:hypothetical protein
MGASAANETSEVSSEARGAEVDARFGAAAADEAGVTGRKSLVHATASSIAVRTDAALLAWQALRGGTQRACAGGEQLFESADTDDEALDDSIAAVESVFELLGA